MKRGAALAAIACVVLMACGPFHRLSSPVLNAASAPRVASPARVASPPRLESPSPAVPTPPALPAPQAVSTAPCRVPLAYISEAYGWFMNFPAGGLTGAPSSRVALPGGQPGAIGANPGLSFDRAARTWVPVPYYWVTPSGGAYVFEDYGSGKIEKVTVPGGAIQVFAPNGWVLFGVSDTGAYASNPTGAYFLPFDGGPRQHVGTQEYWLGYGGNALWGLSGGSNGQVIRYDLATGQEATVATLPGWNDFKGFDSSGDILFDSSNDVPHSDPKQRFTLVAVHPGGQVRPLWSGVGYQPSGFAIGDAHGVWFELGAASGYPGGAAAGLYLWTPQRGARRISKSEGNPAGTCG